MAWPGIEDAMVATRAVHFAATTTMAGTLVFRAAVNPALRGREVVARLFHAQTRRVAWIGLAVAVVTGAIWLLLQAVSMSGLPVQEAMTEDVLATVLNETQFGEITEIRLLLAVVLAGCLAVERFGSANWPALAAALGFSATIAWTGHAGSTPGHLGALHLAADVTHLCAAAAWIGGLVSLALLLTAIGANPPGSRASLAHEVTERFSILGMASVGALMLTGAVNSYILVGTVRALIGSEYGRVLMLKLGLFIAMLAFASFNRFRLTPRLVAQSAGGTDSGAARALVRNSLIEIALGLVVLAIVGLLGTMHPAIHLIK